MCNYQQTERFVAIEGGSCVAKNLINMPIVE